MQTGVGRLAADLVCEQDSLAELALSANDSAAGRSRTPDTGVTVTRPTHAASGHQQPGEQAQRPGGVRDGVSRFGAAGGVSGRAGRGSRAVTNLETWRVSAIGRGWCPGF